MQQANLSFTKRLFGCFAFIAAMIAARMLYCGSLHFLYLLWNLFLAFIPYLVSLLFTGDIRSKKWQLLLFFTWLVFFPNALYLITDLVHLRERAPVPLWYDALLFFTCSLTGLAMGFASLVNAETIFPKLFPDIGRRTKPALIVFIFFVASFGVYLGRFQRWNSWDVLSDPLSLAADILSNFIDPLSHYRTWAITVLFTAMYSVFWFFINSFLRLRPGK